MVSNAHNIWKHLNGAICIYKPPRIGWLAINDGLRYFLCKELNDIVPTKDISYWKNPLVVGPRYTKKRLSIYSTLTDYFSSGVAVVGLRTAWSVVCAFQRTNPLRVYHVKGVLGRGSDTYDIEGKIRERASYHHVTKQIIDKVVASFQATYQRSMYDACGVYLQSQAAYELASRGLIRPADPEVPCFYSIKCVHFDPPEFTLEVQSIGETSLLFKILIHNVGMRLRSVAVCSSIRCIRYGPFKVEHALPRHRWTVDNILENMDVATKLLITDYVSERVESPQLIAPSRHTWEETEAILRERRIIRPPRTLSSGTRRNSDRQKLVESEETQFQEGENNVSKKDSYVLSEENNVLREESNVLRQEDNMSIEENNPIAKENSVQS